MIDLKDFQRFGKKKEEAKANNEKNVWCYTRVSTKDQETNFSLENQKKAAEKFAENNGFSLVKVFGGTYESGKDDFTRKEFSRLLAEVKQAKQKPFAIIVYKMNRFSRSGGHSITLANELLSNQGVNLIEIVSGLDTTTAKGRNELNKRLLAAEEENLNKLEHTIPGMKAFLRAGNWLGKAPLGYDHFGMRVTDFARRDYRQRIVLNETGRLLRQAWEWKLKGEPDYQIVHRLHALGVKTDRKRIGEMWHNVFYCGLIAHKLLDGEVVQGNHEPMITAEMFAKVNAVDGSRFREYETHKNCTDRPLNGHVFCHICGKPLCGYFVAKKGLHYYKCQKCKNVSINANTSKKFYKKTGAHQLFLGQLEAFEMNPKHLAAFTRQIKKLLDSGKQSAKNDTAVFKRKLAELENQKEALQERYAFEGLPKDVYEKFLAKVDSKISDLKAQYEGTGLEIPNLDIKVEKAIDFSQNVSKYWLSSNLDIKRRIQKLVFPEGLVLDTQKRQYLTSKINALFSAKQAFIRLSEEAKKRIPIKNDEDSDLVAGTGFEPMTFGL